MQPHQNDQRGENMSLDLTPKEDSSSAWSSELAKPVHYQLAEALLIILVKKTRTIKRKPIMVKWADVFRKLHLVDGIPTEDIRHALVWYEEHIGEKYVPQAYSASGFRKKYVAIVAAMGRDNNGPQKNVIITEAVHSIQSRLGNLQWPGDEKKDEAIMIQQSLDNHDGFRDILNRLVYEHRSEWMDKLTEYILTKLGHREHFVETWIRNIHNMAWRWGGWPGKLTSFVWNPHCKIFQSTAQGWIAEWCGMPWKWNELLEDIYPRNMLIG